MNGGDWTAGFQKALETRALHCQKHSHTSYPLSQPAYLSFILPSLCYWPCCLDHSLHSQERFYRSHKSGHCQLVDHALQRILSAQLWSRKKQQGNGKISLPHKKSWLQPKSLPTLVWFSLVPLSLAPFSTMSDPSCLEHRVRRISSRTRWNACVNTKN